MCMYVRMCLSHLRNVTLRILGVLYFRCMSRKCKQHCLYAHGARQHWAFSHKAASGVRKCSDHECRQEHSSVEEMTSSANSYAETL